MRIARMAALLSLASLVVHQLRYLLAFGGEAGRELHDQGHAYLTQSLPILLALAGAAIAARLLSGARSASPGAASGPALARGLRYGLAIFCVFSVQELAEGALAPGHPAGLLAVVGAGAWVAAPLAAILGLLAAFAERLLDRAEVALASILHAPSTPVLEPTPAPAPGPAPGVAPLATRALAFGFARRPPPLAARS